MVLESLQNGRYRLLRLIGQGAMGRVYLGEDTRIDRQVAIKVISTEMGAYPDDDATRDAIRLFHREAQTIAKLNHPHILPLFDFDEASSDGSTPTYMVMPFCPEGSFKDWLKQRQDRGPLAPRDIVQLIRQAADALQYAHDRGIIHRDVKPANFLIRGNRDNPNCPDLLLADFGVAKITAAATRSSQAVRGTPIYMSPEQWSGTPVPATDQYALAVMAFELLTGRSPFQGNTNQIMYQHLMAPPPPPSTINPALPEVVNAVILRALAKDPAERYPSISEFARALEQALLPDPASQRTLYPPAPSVLSPVPASPGTVRIPDYSITAAAPSGPGITKTQAISDKQPGFFRARNFAIIGLILLLIFAGTGLAVALLHQNGGGKANSPTATTNGNTTATANARATATASADSTIPGSTATPPALPQTRNPYPPHTGTLVLDDPMHDNSKAYQWDTTNVTGAGGCGFTSNAYHVIQSSPLGGIFICSPEANVAPLSNLTFQVQMIIVKGEAGGIAFRENENLSNYYLFVIGSDGSYELEVANGNNFPSILQHSSSSYIQKGPGQTNLLAVVAIGTSISLYVNNHLLITVTDSTYSSGQIGVAASESFGNSDTADVVFSNAMLWKL
ncbi:MAG TPA: serine/threonine-protein kinase [Ktedonobacteraceae bacterium]|jgi:serine/threonine protein kinase|nr:serine/threonine-protein kinase [Ktedonobacteraceae bacterium]